jgi:hypothetical protein
MSAPRTAPEGWEFLPGLGPKQGYYVRDRDRRVASSPEEILSIEALENRRSDAEGERQAGIQEMEHWFMQEGQQAGNACAAKAYARGAYDLELLGRTMAGFLSVEPEPGDERIHHLLIGVLFYAEGKIARALSALKEGRLPNLDDWHDLSVYGRMAKYITEKGSWP